MPCFGPGRTYGTVANTVKGRTVRALPDAGWSVVDDPPQRPRPCGVGELV